MSDGSTYCGYERATSPEEAHRSILHILESHNLTAQTTRVGDYCETVQARVRDNAIKKEFIGCGKGVGIQSEVSALFEAFEHYIAYVEFHDESKAARLKVRENPSLDLLIEQGLLPKGFVQQVGGPDKTLPWTELRSLHDDQVVLYPLFMAEPGYSPSGKFEYDDSFFWNLSYLSNGSGCGSGSTVHEALVHGLNEAIERDATSLFLYSAFIRNNNVRIVDPETIPECLRTYLRSIEAEFEDELFILDITSHVGVPCFCVTFSRQIAPIMPKGYGASLSAPYALERALLESLQPVRLRNDNLDRVERNTVARLGPYPLLQRAAVADIANVVRDSAITLIDFSEVADLDLGQGLVEQKNLILSAITRAGLSAYYRRVYDIEGYSLVKTVLGGASNLHLLQLGKLILPDSQKLDKRVAAGGTDGGRPQ